MAKWLSVVVTVFFMTPSFTKEQSTVIVSPLRENSFQDNSACITYLNSTLAGFNRPVNSDNGIFRISKDIEEIINKKLFERVLKCRDNSTGSLPTLATQINRDGINFFFDQLDIQRHDFKPRTIPEMGTILEIDTLKVRLNSFIEEILKQETLNRQQNHLLMNYQEDIRSIKSAISMMHQSRSYELTSAIHYQQELKRVQIELAEAQTRKDRLTSRVKGITSTFCNCKKCNAFQKPSFFRH